MAKSTILNSYELSRAWYDWCFENPEKITPSHAAIYFFAIEHCNRLGWKEKFGFPTQMAMDAVGIKKNQTYTKFFTDLCTWGFLKLIQKSTNQYSANIISLSSAQPKSGKALDKALVKHRTKQIGSIGQSTGQSKGTIDKQRTNNNKTIEQRERYRSFAHLTISVIEFENLISEGWSKGQIDEILDSVENYSKNGKYKNLYLTAKKWLKKDHKPSKIQTALSVSEQQDRDILKKYNA